MPPRAPKLIVSDGDRRLLNRVIQRRKVSARMVLRARIVLGAAKGLSNVSLAARIGVSRPTVILWRRRYRTGGFESLFREISNGTARRIPASTRAAILSARRVMPAGRLPAGYIAEIARRFGVGKSSVTEIWRLGGTRRKPR